MRVRRYRPTRLGPFVAAAFAFAVPRVAISPGHVPDRIDAMLLALHGVPTFATCFLLPGRIRFTQGRSRRAMARLPA